MSGKAYTFKEMKAMVDYLVEQKAYNEIKGRKMWMDYANSQMTSRTWQSLKETFLKRILPDIYNPYYKLTVTQIQSFKQAKDIETLQKNRLEIRTVTEDSSTNNDNADTEGNVNMNKPAASNEADKPSGEIPATVTPPRSSPTDVNQDHTYYNNAEEIQNDLEGNSPDATVQSKSHKDCIEFEGTEELTADVRKVLHDFASDSENSDIEAQMEIVVVTTEDPHVLKFNQGIDDVATISDSQASEQLNEIEKFIQNTDTCLGEVKSEADRISSMNETNFIEVLDTAVSNSESVEIPPGQDKIEQSVQNTQGLTRSTDTILPNNQEALNRDTQTEKVNGVTKEDISDSKVDKSKVHNETDGIDNESQVNNSPKRVNNKIKEKDSRSKQDAEKGELNDSKANDNKSKTDDDKSKENDNNSKTKNVVEKKSILRKRSASSQDSKSSKKAKVNKEIETSTPIEITSSDKANTEEVETGNEIETRETRKNKNNTRDKKVDKQESSKPNNNEIINIDDRTEREKSTEPDPVDVLEAKKSNPCLQSVSLFEEHFNAVQFSSDSEDNVASGKQEKSEDPIKCHLIKKMINREVILLKSHSESDDEAKTRKDKKTAQQNLVDKSTVNKNQVDKSTVDKNVVKQKEKALASAFGFSGGVKEKKRIAPKKRRYTHSHNIDSNSSGWTSESDSQEYVSPPRGRKGKHSRKYLRPKSARIISLEEEGGLFVMYRNRIYPIVKGGKNGANYMTYNPGSDSEEDNSYWRQKYVEEKMKTNELKKQLDIVQKESVEKQTRDKSPILPSKRTYHKIDLSQKEDNDVSVLSKNKESKESIREAKQDRKEEKIKITFAKNNHEVKLEGHWPQIHPVFQQVVDLLQNDNENQKSEATVEVKKKESKQSTSAQNKAKELTVKQPVESVETVTINSGQTTPIIPAVDPGDIPEIHSKMSDIEREIFKEIEDRDKEEKSKRDDADTDSTNVTQRKGRPRKSTISVSPAKRQKRAKPSTETLDTVSNTRNSDISTNAPSNTRNSDVSKTEPQTEGRRYSKRQSASKKSVSEDEKPALNTRSAAKSTVKPTKDDDDDQIRYMLRRDTSMGIQTKTRSARSLQIEITQASQSIDSTLGYQDSDVSPINMTKRKRKPSLRVANRRGKRSSVRSLPDLSHINSDSSHSSYFVPVKSSQVTLNSEAYKSESYQLLMPVPKPKVNSLGSIQESPNRLSVRHFDAVSKEVSRSTNDNSDIVIERANSSNVSLPLSPELSVVENFTVSREMIKSQLMMSQMPGGDETSYNKYVISDIDVSVPLMEQECGLRKSTQDVATNKSLLKKIETVNLQEKSLSDSLDTKLRDLLLESAKKISNNDNFMDVDIEKMDVDESKVVKKTRTRKRCSTPHKKSTRQGKMPDNSVIEEERTESCVLGGRTSCPPTIIYTTDENANNCDDIPKKVTKARKKKDIIKVKIQRPRTKSGGKKSINKNDTTASICTDSGINNTDSISELLKADDSIDLIHNHSETCLHAHECIGSNSVEIIESSKSIVSINSDSCSLDTHLYRLSEDVERLSGDSYFNTDAQDVSSFEKKTPDNIFHSPTETIYHSPALTHSSLITEDLSDDPPSQPTTWYLLSEDETQTQARNLGHLKQIFPITCAIPDLSTISERSKENEDSRKPTLDTDGDTGNSDSQSLF